MRALAWDDKPEEYMVILKKYLVRFGIDIEIVETEEEFVDRFYQGGWDFVISDLVRKDSPAQGEVENLGDRLARAVSESQQGKNMTVFLVTEYYDRVSDKAMKLPANVIVKSKSTFPGWMAGEIYQELVRRGVYVNRKRVFLIYGHDHGAHEDVEAFLSKHGIKVIRLGDGVVLGAEIAQGLVASMNECGAFVALCTPDDQVDKDGQAIFQPRLNVLLEIGLAMGLSRGLQRLLLVQRWGPEPEHQAVLPSDLAGVLTLRFREISQALPELRRQLESIGIEFSGA